VLKADGVLQVQSWCGCVSYPGAPGCSLWAKVSPANKIAMGSAEGHVLNEPYKSVTQIGHSINAESLGLQWITRQVSKPILARRRSIFPRLRNHEILWKIVTEVMKSCHGHQGRLALRGFN